MFGTVVAGSELEFLVRDNADRIGTAHGDDVSSSGPKLVVDQSSQDIMHLIRLNTIGQTMLARHFGKSMAERGRGGIILVGSGGAHAGCYQLAVYSAVKAYTMTFSEGLWAELHPNGVDVAALMIGRTRTPALERSEYGQDSEVAAAEPDDIARFALANLADGPVLVPPELQASFLALRAMPRRQAVQRPQAVMHEIRTRSPGWNAETPDPVASTIPTPS